MRRVTRMLRPALGSSVAMLLLLGSAGCLSPLALHRAVVEYDKATADVESEMLLLNVARARHTLPLHFTRVSSVAATFNFQATGALVPAAAGGTAALVAPTFGATAAENPTITIIPVQGEQFTKRVLSPLSAEKAIFLLQGDEQLGIRGQILMRLLVSMLVVKEGEQKRILRNDPVLRQQYTEFRRTALRLVSLSLSGVLRLGPIVFDTVLPVTVSSDSFLQALEKGYQWRSRKEGPPLIAKRTVGRLLVSNYDPAELSNRERIELNHEGEGHPENSLMIDIRPGRPGGEHPLQGYFVFRSFADIVRFIGRGISTATEFHVEEPPGADGVPMNPAATLQVHETKAEPQDAAVKVQFAGLWYSIPKETEPSGSIAWNQEAFRILAQLYQLTVTDVSNVPAPAITISK